MSIVFLKIVKWLALSLVFTSCQFSMKSPNTPQRNIAKIPSSKIKNPVVLKDFLGTYAIQPSSDRDCPDGVFSAKGTTLRIGAEISIKNIGEGPQNVSPHKQYACATQREAKILGRRLEETRREICGPGQNWKRKIVLNLNDHTLELKILRHVEKKTGKDSVLTKTCFYKKSVP